MVVGHLWGIRTEVVARQAFPLVTGVQTRDCKSIAKASKVRILHLPPRAERALDVMKERGLLPLPVAPPSVMIGSIQVPYERARRPLMEAYAGKQFVGIDLHRRRTVIVRTTEAGEVLSLIHI